ncbi:hypothetical protein CU098_012050 [Rhizopus stolonifer]|uniref:ADP-ribosylglycohydrolase n=1 Tax=Rhizopus stolonifer TaxID=4846 RepID=A0A367KP31_RHIST|nr:hypothetical protein CU098_012050 [Rhizopus stolonifer]
MHIPSGCSNIENSVIIDKIKGLIFGAILGDSIAIATKGLSKDQVKDIYGAGPIRFGMDDKGTPFLRDEYRSSFDENDFGNDAEQILLIVDSIMENKGYFHLKDFLTRATDYNEQSTSALVRAPLLGVLKFWDGTSVIENTTNICQWTHPDPRCMISCLVISILIARILRGQDLEIQLQPTADSFTDQTLQVLVRDVIETNRQIFQGSVNQEYFYPLLVCSEPSSLDSLQLDKTDDVFHSLGAALYCFTRAIPAEQEPDYFKRLMMEVIMQGGKADTNATTAGAILGARLGYSQLPTEWVVGMKRWEWLEDRVDAFCSLF